jgi:hypothetical protein
LHERVRNLAIQVGDFFLERFDLVRDLFSLFDQLRDILALSPSLSYLFRDLVPLASQRVCLGSKATPFAIIF